MATSESTTQQSAREQLIAQSSSLAAERPRSRRLTVSSGAVSGGEGSAPYIRLLGRWLEHAGFTIGSKVDVRVAPGQLVIETAPPVVEHKPRLPRQAQKLFF
jgi:hypothetical protein